MSNLENKKVDNDTGWIELVLKRNMIITLKYKTLLSINELNKLIHDLETYDSMIIESVNTNENIITVKLNKTCTVDYLHELQILHDIRFYLNVNDGEDD